MRILGLLCLLPALCLLLYVAFAGCVWGKGTNWKMIGMTVLTGIGLILILSGCSQPPEFNANRFWGECDAETLECKIQCDRLILDICKGDQECVDAGRNDCARFARPMKMEETKDCQRYCQ